MNTEKQTHLHADNSEDELTVEATLSTTEEPHHERAETFADFNVRADIVSALADAGIIHPFPIQAMTLPVALGGHDIIGQAKTGTGKTLGFGIPILQRVISPTDDGFDALTKSGKPQALTVTPTRELAVQVASDLERAGAKRGVRVLTVYGGRAYEPQIDALRRGSRSSSARPADSSTWPNRVTSTSRRPARSSSTRRTRCSTSGSCPTSRR